MCHIWARFIALLRTLSGMHDLVNLDSILAIRSWRECGDQAGNGAMSGLRAAWSDRLTGFRAASANQRSGNQLNSSCHGVHS